jgi:hypothetical protein
MAENHATQKPLSRPAALISAIRNLDIDHFPQVKGKDGTPVLLGTPEMMTRFGESTKDWGLTEEKDVEKAIDFARQSLDEVKEQTEYQDQKATRLLTVTTFLSAFAGAVFLRFSEAYPLSALFESSVITGILALISYALFGLFVLFAVCGALITFHATRTRFKYTDSELVAKDKSPKSRLFFRGITGVTPEAWGKAYVGSTTTPAGGAAATTAWSVNPGLAEDYLRDLVAETYLVACKTADKLRILDPAQRFLASSLRFLLGWLISLALLMAIPPFLPNAEAKTQDDAEQTGSIEIDQGPGSEQEAGSVGAAGPDSANAAAEGEGRSAPADGQQTGHDAGEGAGEENAGGC